jgi:hypothetical protein
MSRLYEPLTHKVVDDEPVEPDFMFTERRVFYDLYAFLTSLEQCVLLFERTVDFRF